MLVKIRWRITDNLAEVDLAEFNTEWNGIYGFFESPFYFCVAVNINRNLMEVEYDNNLL